MSTSSQDQQQFRLFSCGSNSHGQLGVGHDADSASYVPALVCGSEMLPGRVRSMAFGGTHTLLLCTIICEGAERSELYVAGSSSKGQSVGTSGSDGQSLSFQKLSLETILNGISNEDAKMLEDDRAEYAIENVAASWETSFVHIRSAGKVTSDVLLSMGGNDWNELGTASPSTSSVQLVCFDHLLRPTSRASTASSSPSLRIGSITAGPRHIVAQIELIESLNDGSTSSTRHLVGWGASRHGQLAQHHSHTDSSLLMKTIAIPNTLCLANYNIGAVLKFAIGRDHTMLLPSSTTLLCIGNSSQNQLGPSVKGSVGVIESRSIGATANEMKVSQEIDWIGSSWTTSYVLVKGGAASPTHLLFGFGSNAHGQLGCPSTTVQYSTPTPHLIDLALTPSSSGIERVVCGSEHVVVLISDAKSGSTRVLSWGWNEHGNIGTGDLRSVEVPIQVWPLSEEQSRWHAVDVWAGNATSWIQVEAGLPMLK